MKKCQLHWNSVQPKQRWVIWSRAVYLWWSSGGWSEKQIRSTPSFYPKRGVPSKIRQIKASNWVWPIRSARKLLNKMYSSYTKLEIIWRIWTIYPKTRTSFQQRISPWFWFLILPQTYSLAALLSLMTFLVAYHFYFLLHHGKTEEVLRQPCFPILWVVESKLFRPVASRVSTPC